MSADWTHKQVKSPLKSIVKQCSTAKSQINVVNTETFFLKYEVNISLLHLISHYPHDNQLACCPSHFLLHFFWKKNPGISGPDLYGLDGGCPSCHPTNMLKYWIEINIFDPNEGKPLAPYLMHCQTPEARCVAPCMPAFLYVSGKMKQM